MDSDNTDDPSAIWRTPLEGHAEGTLMRMADFLDAMQARIVAYDLLQEERAAQRSSGVNEHTEEEEAEP